MVSEVCSSVAVEPDLQQLLVSREIFHSGSGNWNNGARVDVATDGFWGSGKERTFLDIQVFNPNASGNRRTSLSSTYKWHENEKKRVYCQRINEVDTVHLHT